MQDRSQRILGLSQKSYNEKVLSRFDMKGCSSGDTPIAKGDKFSLNQCPKTDLEIKEMQKIPYSSTIGSLMYAQVCTRPDIVFVVGLLGRYLSIPGLDHWKIVKRVMRYLQRMKDLMLTYRKSDSLEKIGYSDSDFAGCLDNRRSTSGYVFMLARGSISWKSVKQTLVATLTMVAEFMACFEASVNGIWLCNFVTRLHVVNGIERPLKLYYEIKSTILFSHNRSSVKEKHIDIKFLSLKEKVENGQVSIEHIRTNSILADPLTKGLSPKVFHEHTTHMGVGVFCNTLV